MVGNTPTIFRFFAPVGQPRSMLPALSGEETAYAITQDGLRVPDVAEISTRASCAPKHGPADARLFLPSDWLDKQPVQASLAPGQ